MSRTVILVAALAAILAIGWWAFGDADPGGDRGADAVEPGTAPDPESPLRTERVGPELEGAPPWRRAPDRAPPRPPIPTNLIPTGGLDVLVLGPDLEPLEADAATVMLTRIGADFHAPPLPLRDPETGRYRFRRVIWGDVRVSVTGDHVVDTAVTARIPRGGLGYAEVVVDRAGAILYEAELYSGEAPSEVTLTLLAAEGRTAVAAWFQVREVDYLTSPRRVTTITQAAKGIVYGIPPGDYVLRAESPEREWDEVAVKIRPRQTETVKFRIRK